MNYQTDILLLAPKPSATKTPTLNVAFKIFIHYAWVFGLHVYLCTTHLPWRPERPLDPLEWESQAIVSHHVSAQN